MRLPWNKRESELEREIRYHLDSLAENFERQGYSRAEAMLRAQREFGGAEQFKEQCRDERRWRPLARLGQDIAFGLRMLRRGPAVTIAAVLSLALGIGATTAILSLVDAVLWRTLGVPRPEQLTEIVWQSKGRPEGLFHGSSGSMYPDGPLRVADFFSRSAFDAMRRGTGEQLEVAGHLNSDDVSTSYGGVTAVARLRPVSGNFFKMLKVEPAAGRLLMESDDNPGAPLAVTVSHFFWQKNLHGDPKATGRTLRINNRAYVIIGVVPARFRGISVGDSTDLYTTIEHAPQMLNPESWERRAAADPLSWYIQLLARRSPGVTAEAVRPALDTLFRSSWAAQPKNPQVVPTIRLQDASGGIGGLRREFGSPLAMLFSLVGFVLMIACANIANLMLARADARRREVALRVALGCSRGRLVRQFFTESALLALFGGLTSLIVTYAVANFAVTLMPGNLRLDFEIDGRMMLATLAVTAVTALAFGLYPAWRAAQTDAAPALNQGSASVGGIRHGLLNPGKLLVFGQVALGVLLVAAGSAFTAHLRKILASETGFERTRLLVFDLRPGESGYRGPRLQQFYMQLEQRLGEVPGLEAVGLARIRPMKGGGYFDEILLGGQTKRISTAVNFVTAGYLRALGVPIVEGRGITEQDVRTKAAVAVVSQDMGKELGRSPLGLTFKSDDRLFEIVGVAAPARYGRLTQEQHVLYLPNSLSQDAFTVLLRTTVPPMQVFKGVREAIGSLDSNLPIVDPLTMEEQIATTLRRERLFAWLCGAFGALALLLCMIGLYGVMSYATTRRRQEIGLRMALGASPGMVLRNIVGEAAGIAVAGCVLGAPVAWWAAHKYVDYKKLGMEPLDPSILVWATAALAASAIVAVLGPAFRAASADPIKALRDG